jgi:SAM-dependent methyltransferase
VKPLFAAIAAVVVVEGLQQMSEHQDRWIAWRSARQIADSRDLPLLNIGCPRMYPFKYPCGDTCLDISQERLSMCQSAYPVFGDVRDIPFEDGYFGAVLCTHVLEHMATIDDARLAIAEMKRVSGGQVFIASPDRSSVAAWIHPEHRLWVEDTAEGILVAEQRER